MPHAKHSAKRQSRSLLKELEREKQASRDADRRDLASGRKSADQIRRENELFYGLRYEIDYKSCRDPR